MADRPQNMRAFRLRYLGATNTKGSRIKIIDCRFNKSKTIDRSYKYMDGSSDAIAYLTGRGIKIEYAAELSDSETLLLTHDFEVQIK